MQSVVKATNDNIVPILLTLNEALNNLLIGVQSKVIKEHILKIDACDRFAKKFEPFYCNEMILWEMKINKKMMLWTENDFTEFETYFKYKYKLNEVAKILK